MRYTTIGCLGGAALLAANLLQAQSTGSKSAPAREKQAVKAPAARTPAAKATSTPPASAKAEKSTNAEKTAVADRAAGGSKLPAKVASIVCPKTDPADSGQRTELTKEWAQWGGSSTRNNTPIGHNIPTDFKPGSFDPKTGVWKKETSKNVRWVAKLGSKCNGNPVVADGKVFLGTNNGGGYLKRYPSQVDLGVLLCFDQYTGKFLWQHSGEKLPSGFVHDWPLEGVCSTSYVEGDRLWFVTNRGEVRCLDTEGFHDGENDGPYTQETGRVFDLPKKDDPKADQQAAAIEALDSGKLNETLVGLFQKAGSDDVKADAQVTVDSKGKAWSFNTQTASGLTRQIRLRMEGPNLSAHKQITPDDATEADVVWVLDMMGELGISQHNMCSSSITCVGDVLWVITGNGVDESHINIPAPGAPSFIAIDKHTGKVLWKDRSPGNNILHGQWSSPTYAVLGGVPQIMFAGGDAWLYSFRADPANPELLWKFDANPKESKYILGGRGTRNEIIATPVVYKGLVYLAVGQDPEHGEGDGHLWCIDPTKRGDVSPELAFSLKDPKTPIPARRLQNVDATKGEVARTNPNSALVWHFSGQDLNGNGKIDFEEQMHRTICTVAVKDDLLFIADFSGIFHCLDAATGQCYWSHDLFAATWGSPLIVEDKVYMGDEEGKLTIFKLSKQKEIVGEINMGSTIYSTPIVADNTLFVATRTHLFAIGNDASDGKQATKSSRGKNPASDQATEGKPEGKSEKKADKKPSADSDDKASTDKASTDKASTDKASTGNAKSDSKKDTKKSDAKEDNAGDK